MRTTQSTAWLMLIVSFALMGFWGKKEEKKPVQEAAPASAAAAPAPQAQGQSEAVPAVGEKIQVADQTGTVVYKFADDNDMRTFAELWQQRRGLMTRMAVLRAYLSEEQVRLEELDNQFESDYSVDTTKKFVLDSDRGLLVELDQPEQLESGANGEGLGPAGTAQ
jgi:hypothetical protein